jgi:hypothetical protein
MRSISHEYKTRGFKLIWTLTLSNSHTSSIDVLCYWDWLFSLSFEIFRWFSRDVFCLFLDVNLSSLFIVGEPSHRV